MTITERINVHYGKKFEAEFRKLIDGAKLIIDNDESIEFFEALEENVLNAFDYKVCGIWVYSTFHKAIKRTNKAVSIITKES